MTKYMITKSTANSTAKDPGNGQTPSSKPGSNAKYKSRVSNLFAVFASEIGAAKKRAMPDDRRELAADFVAKS
jgi:hypothetical protein